jgi:hydroxyacyl-ACP dehydratase HTD2-like protein with hotdog domain
MWNAHHIHLDKDYSVAKEGYPGLFSPFSLGVTVSEILPERLVHGPLTSLMLLEGLVDHRPDARIHTFEYRARNPLIVGRKLAVHGHWEDQKTMSLWCMDEDGVVGMTGKVGLV